MNHFKKQEEEPLYMLPRYSEDLKGNFNSQIFDMLPTQIKGALGLVDNQNERDILLLGMLTVMSGCMPNVKAMYDRRWVYPNLYTFIEAPAGAGKGILSWAKMVGAPVHQYLSEKTRLAREQFETIKKEKIKQKDPDASDLKEPPFRLLFVPANNSASSMVQTLAENEGAGILFSTEADTLANSLAQDWGNFSDVLRCAFHHESIDLQRRTNREYLSVEQPRLSVLLTGTRGQLLRLIPNTENGLFSRFMYYSFPAVPSFRNVFQANGTDVGQAFLSLGHFVLEMYHFLNALGQPLEFHFDENQSNDFLNTFRNITAVTFSESGVPILGTVHRLGLMAFRISMVLTMFRYYSKVDRQLAVKIRIQNQDYRIAMQLVLHLLFHANVLIADMQGGSKQLLQQTKMTKLYNNLPESFNRQEAVKAADKLGLSASTLTRYLVNGQFERIGQGQYKKIIIKQTDEQLSNEQMSNS